MVKRNWPIFQMIDEKMVSEKQILDKSDIEKIIFRISNKILEKNLNPSTLFIIGIKKGDVLAKRIAKKIESIDGKK